MDLNLHNLIGFPVGLLIANGIEWQMHRFIHRRGREKGKFWSFHVHAHHVTTRANGFTDPNCGPRPRMLLWSGLVALPLSFIVHGVSLGMLSGALLYWYIHHKAHRDPEFALRWIPWHVEHHMAPNQDENWCVTFPLFDWIMGTRVKYIGTSREAELSPIGK